MPRDYLYGIMTDRNHGFLAVFAKALLRIISYLYRGVAQLKNNLYEKNILKSARLERPVISIGNLTWGGSGKTPMVLFLAAMIKAKGFHPAVLTRGYMAGGGQADSTFSDEVEMLRREILDLPIGVGGNRVKSSQEVLAKTKVDIFILDDGFQHRQVYRDLDNVLVDGTNPFGNGALLPRGILREPITGVSRANIIVITKADLDSRKSKVTEERLKELNSHALIVSAIHQPQACVDLVTRASEPVTCLKGKRIAAFCSIADARGFEKTLGNLGAQVIRLFDFPDHYSYSADDIKLIIDFVQKEKLDGLVTTAKDEVKILPFQPHFSAGRCWILKINMVIQNNHEEFLGRITGLLGR